MPRLGGLDDRWQQGAVRSGDGDADAAEVDLRICRAQRPVARRLEVVGEVARRRPREPQRHGYVVPRLAEDVEGVGQARLAEPDPIGNGVQDPSPVPVGLVVVHVGRERRQRVLGITRGVRGQVQVRVRGAGGSCGRVARPRAVGEVGQLPLGLHHQRGCLRLGGVGSVEPAWWQLGEAPQVVVDLEPSLSRRRGGGSRVAARDAAGPSHRRGDGGHVGVVVVSDDGVPVEVSQHHGRRCGPQLHRG